MSFVFSTAITKKTYSWFGDEKSQFFIFASKIPKAIVFGSFLEKNRFGLWFAWNLAERCAIWLWISIRKAFSKFWKLRPFWRFLWKFLKIFKNWKFWSKLKILWFGPKSLPRLKWTVRTWWWNQFFEIRTGNGRNDVICVELLLWRYLETIRTCYMYDI